MSRSYFGLFTALMCLPITFCLGVAIIAYEKEPFFAGVMIGLVPMYVVIWAFNRHKKQKALFSLKFNFFLASKIADLRRVNFELPFIN